MSHHYKAQGGKNNAKKCVQQIVNAILGQQTVCAIDS